MSGVIHFKFKSSNSYDSVGFEGAFISVSELKVLIAEKKGLSKDATSELLLSDPRTQVDYNDDAAVIPKSSSVLVRRVPNLPPAQLTYQQSASAAPAADPNSNGAPANPPAPSGNTAGEEDFGGDLYSEQRDEDSALTQLLNQRGQTWQDEIKESSVRGRGRGRGFGRGRDFSGRGMGRGRGREAEPIVLPKGYICYRCGQQGHHISDCPTNTDPDFKRIRPAVGVPSVLLSKDKEGGLLLPDGSLGSLQPNEKAFMNEIRGMPGAAASPEPSKPAADPPAAADAAGSDAGAKPDAGAMVVYGGGGGTEPALAGSSELGGFPLGPPGGLLLPPVPGMPGWELAAGGLPLLPGMGLPGLGTPGAPMTREEFERMQAEFKRKQDRGRRSKSRSRSPSRHRRRSRDSRSPRRRDSPKRGYRSRRHRSRDRSVSRDRGFRRPYYPPRRRSPSPGFIQLRKRGSNSPPPRRRAAFGQEDRRRESVSPPRRRPRRDYTQPAPTRWQQDGAEGDAPPAIKPDSPDPKGGASKGQVEDSLDSKWDPEERSASPPRARERQDFSVPELMGDPAASFPMGAEEISEPRPSAVRKSSSAGLGTSKSRMHSRSSKRKAEDPPGGLPPVAESGGRTSKPSRASPAPGRKDEGPPPDADSDKEEPRRAGLLPKTFKVPVDDSYREKKHKKSKKSKDKDREPEDKQAADDRAVEETAAPANEQKHSNGLDDISNYASADPDSEASRRGPQSRSQPGGSKLELQETESMEEAARRQSPEAAHPTSGSGGRRQQAPLFLKAMTEAAGGERSHKSSSRHREGSTREKLVALIRDQEREEPEAAPRAASEDRSDSRGKEKKRKEHKSKHKSHSKKKHKEKRSKHDS